MIQPLKLFRRSRKPRNIGAGVEDVESMNVGTFALGLSLSTIQSSGKRRGLGESRGGEGKDAYRASSSVPNPTRK